MNNGEMARTDSESMGRLARGWEAWCRFWFTPADPTPLCFMRIVAGLLTLYVHIAYCFDLPAFFGPDAWYDGKMANTTRVEMPWVLPLMSWEDPVAEADFRFPIDTNQRRFLHDFTENTCRDANTRQNVIQFLSSLPKSPEQRNEVVRFIRQLPTDANDRSSLLKKFVDDQLSQSDKEFLPEAIRNIPTAETRSQFVAEMLRFESVLPSDRQGMSQLVNMMQEMSSYDWEAMIAFLRDLPADAKDRAKIVDFMQEWGIHPKHAYAFGSKVYSPWFHITDERVMWLVHSIHLTIMVMFTLGLFTRVTSVLTWLAALSYINRAQPILFGQDTMMNLSLFYLMLAPCGATWSLDRLITRWRAGRKSFRTGKRPDLSPADAPLVSANFALRLLQVQYCMMYMSAGLSKLKGGTWWSGVAPHGTLANPEFTPMHIEFYRSALQALCESRPLWEIHMNALVVFTLFVEIAFPFLIWTRLRPIMVAGAIMLHLGIAFFMGLSIFSLFMFALLLCWIPATSIKRMFGHRPDDLSDMQLVYEPTSAGQSLVAARVYAMDVWDQVEITTADSAAKRRNGELWQETTSARLVMSDDEQYHGYQLLQRLASELWLLKPISLLLRLPGLSHVGKAIWPGVQPVRSDGATKVVAS